MRDYQIEGLNWMIQVSPISQTRIFTQALYRSHYHNRLRVRSSKPTASMASWLTRWAWGFDSRTHFLDFRTHLLDFGRTRTWSTERQKTIVSQLPMFYFLCNCCHNVENTAIDLHPWLLTEVCLAISYPPTISREVTPASCIYAWSL